MESLERNVSVELLIEDRPWSCCSILDTHGEAIKRVGGAYETRSKYSRGFRLWVPASATALVNSLCWAVYKSTGKSVSMTAKELDPVDALKKATFSWTPSSGLRASDFFHREYGEARKLQDHAVRDSDAAAGAPFKASEQRQSSEPKETTTAEDAKLVGALVLLALSASAAWWSYGKIDEAGWLAHEATLSTHMGSDWLLGESKSCFVSTNGQGGIEALYCGEGEGASHDFPTTFRGKTHPTFSAWRCQRLADKLDCSLEK